MTCSDCNRPLVLPATSGGPALLGIVVHTKAGPFCRSCGAWPDAPAQVEPKKAGRR